MEMEKRVKERKPEDLAEDYATNLYPRYIKDAFTNEEIEDVRWTRARNDFANGFRSGRQFEVLLSIMSGSADDRGETK